VLAIGNKIPEDEIETAGFDISTTQDPSAEAATATSAAGKPAAAAGASESEKKRHALERELIATRRKIEIAALERENALLAEQREVVRLGAELEVAQSRLAIFREMTLPTKTRSADLDLQSQRHHLQDAQDELRQLEMLYAGSELEDRTAEVVLARGRRQLEQTQGRLEVAETDRNRIVERELPLEAGEKERELGKAEFAVAQHQRGMAISQMKAEAELAELREKLAETEREIAALAKTGAGSGSGATPTAAAASGATGSPR